MTRIGHVIDIRAMDFDDSSKTMNCSTMATWRCQFGPSNRDTEELALCATANHAIYFRTLKIRTPNAALDQLHHNEAATQMYSCHVLCEEEKKGIELDAFSCLAIALRFHP